MAASDMVPHIHIRLSPLNLLNLHTRVADSSLAVERRRRDRIFPEPTTWLREEPPTGTDRWCWLNLSFSFCTVLDRRCRFTLERGQK